MDFQIYNEDCFETMDKMSEKSIDVIMTSPFYNTNKKAGKNGTILNTQVKKGNYQYVRYDTHVDNLTDEEYNQFTVRLFNNFDKILKNNGVILYNISYGGQNTTGMYEAVVEVLRNTVFTLADTIIWKKSNALPNSVSPNKLTRIVEYIFVFVRKDEFYTFNSNKKIVSKRSNGQKMYESIYNFIEAKNNDEVCPYNKATYSSDLVNKLFSIYVHDENLTVYDPFLGSGTTAISCIDNNLNFIGSEISENQCKWAENRILQYKENYFNIAKERIENHNKINKPK